MRTVWLGLSYAVPITPSKARVYVWRKLREIGAEYFRQGVAILPNTVQSTQQFTALSQKIRQMGGEASIVELRFTAQKDEDQMTARFKKQIQDEYTQLLSDCASALRELRERAVTPKENDRIKQMVKRFRKARERDYFKACTTGELEAGINEMIESVREVAGDFGKQLRALMEGS